MMKSVKSLFRRFKSSEEGSVTIEMLLMMPLLVWAVAATVVYFDGFRSKLMVQKSTSTIADAISRVLVTIEPEYMDGMSNLFEVLTPTVTDRGLRMSLVTYDLDADEHDVLWSTVRGTLTAELTNADLISHPDNLPLMADGERYIIVETTAKYNNAIASLFGPVLTDVILTDQIPITPRLEYTVCYKSSSTATAIC